MQRSDQLRDRRQRIFRLRPIWIWRDRDITRNEPQALTSAIQRPRLGRDRDAAPLEMSEKAMDRCAVRRRRPQHIVTDADNFASVRYTAT
jgi:hypothetical protein